MDGQTSQNTEGITRSIHRGPEGQAAIAVSALENGTSRGLEVLFVDYLD